MPFGYSAAGTTGFSSTVRNAIQKRVIQTLRAGLVALPKGSVVPAQLKAGSGDNFTVILTEYPDLVDAAATIPITEGVVPTVTQLGISTNSYTVQQVGAWTNATDIAQFQNPHNLSAVATDKIARLAVQTVDNLALQAIAAHTLDKEYLSSILSTAALLDIKGELNARNIQPVPGVGYYALIHPYALRGLEGESALNGYIDVTSHNAAEARTLTAGAVAQYRGITFVKSSRIASVLSNTARGAVTGVVATDLFTSTAHGLVSGMRIQFQNLTGTFGGPANNTDYWVLPTGLTANDFKVSATKGGAVLDITGTSITGGTLKSEQFPIYFLGQNSMAAGDVSTFDYLKSEGPTQSDPLAQTIAVGFKGIFGAKVLSFAETVVGGTNATATDRVMSISVASGETL